LYGRPAAGVTNPAIFLISFNGTGVAVLALLAAQA
jgi:hypothetical protein